MRKLVTRSVLAVVALLVMATSARADLIPIGTLDWLESEDTDHGYFSIVNQTGVNTTDDFPVATQLLFSALNLAVTNGDASIDNLSFADFTSPDGGLSYDTGLYLGPLLAELTGSVPAGIVTLSSGTNAAWNGQWNILTGVLVNGAGLSPIAVDPTTGEFLESVIIYVDAEKVVPEPLSLGLFATGFAAVMIRRRRSARQ
jgi:hypothetical protein